MRARAAAEAAAVALAAAAAAAASELDPACPERFSLRQQKKCGFSVGVFFLLVVVLIALTFGWPLPLYSVLNRSTMTLVTEYQPDALSRGIAVTYSIDSLASFLQLNVWFRLTTSSCALQFNQLLVSDDARYAAIYVPFISKYGIDMSYYARTSYSDYSTVNEWYVGFFFLYSLRN